MSVKPLQVIYIPEFCFKLNAWHVSSYARVTGSHADLTLHQLTFRWLSFNSRLISSPLLHLLCRAELMELCSLSPTERIYRHIPMKPQSAGEKKMTAGTSSSWNGVFCPHYSCQTESFAHLQIKVLSEGSLKCVARYSPIRYVRNRLCTCCPIQATASRLLITEAKYCGEQVTLQLAQTSSAHSIGFKETVCATCIIQVDFNRRCVAYVLCSTGRGCH